MKPKLVFPLYTPNYKIVEVFGVNYRAKAIIISFFIKLLINTQTYAYSILNFGGASTSPN